MNAVSRIVKYFREIEAEMEAEAPELDDQELDTQEAQDKKPGAELTVDTTEASIEIAEPDTD